MVAAAQVEETILELLQSSPGMGTAAIAKATSAQRSTTDERLKRLRAKGLIERDDASAGLRTPASRPRDRRFARAWSSDAMRMLDQAARQLQPSASRGDAFRLKKPWLVGRGLYASPATSCGWSTPRTRCLSSSYDQRIPGMPSARGAGGGALRAGSPERSATLRRRA